MGLQLMRRRRTCCIIIVISIVILYMMLILCQPAPVQAANVSNTEYAEDRTQVYQSLSSIKQSEYYVEYNMIVTAYSLDYQSCNKHPWEEGYGVTSSGKKINRDIFASDGIIAAPKEFRFGTKMHIEDWGTGTVYDRGGFIKWDEKNNMFRLDIFFDTKEEALQWGIQVKKVKVFL